MLKFNRLRDCVVTNKNVIVRCDINVAVTDGRIEDDTRIRAVIPTLKYLAQNQAKVIVMSHLGRPQGKFTPEMSIQHLVSRFQELLGPLKVSFVADCIGKKVAKAVAAAGYGEIIILENLRFYLQEMENDAEFSRQLASLGNLYVNDAFSCSHRNHASIVGIPLILKSCAGFLLEAELDNLNNYLQNAQKPVVAVVGGAKVSTKIDLLKSLATSSQTLVIAGAMANTFLYAMGKNIGKSLCEKDLKNTALEITAIAKKNNCRIFLPSDLVVTKKLEQNARCKIIAINEVAEDEIIADTGPLTIVSLTQELQFHKTLLWNGPLGAFEFKPFNIATQSFARAVAGLTRAKKLVSVAGGGDSVSALNAAGLSGELSYVSNAGGAFLQWLEEKDLPGIKAISI
jgi:phosphoglycerate kinase